MSYEFYCEQSQNDSADQRCEAKITLTLINIVFEYPENPIVENPYCQLNLSVVEYFYFSTYVLEW
jgi:hypothetical protein